MEAGSSQSTAGVAFNLTDSLDETTALYTTDDSSSSEENACHYTFARMANTVADNKHKDSALAVKRYAFAIGTLLSHVLAPHGSIINPSKHDTLRQTISKPIMLSCFFSVQLIGRESRFTQ